MEDIPVKNISPQANSTRTPRHTPAKFSPIKKLFRKNVVMESPRYKLIVDSDTESESSVRSDESWKNSDSDGSLGTSADESPQKVSEIKKKSMRVSHRVFHISDESDGDSDDCIIKRKSDDNLRKDRQREMLDKLDSFEYRKLPVLGTPKTETKQKRKLFTHSHFAEDFEDLSLENEKEKENENPKV